MVIQTLYSTPMPAIVDCILTAFEGYFVQLPHDIDYWENRFNASRVDLNYSYGAFDNDRLVAVVIHGIDTYEGKLTAFNQCTGVVASHRGKHIIDKIYQVAIPSLKSIGVKQCRLEVIQDNLKAINVYKRIGFSIDKSFLCFKGKLSNNNSAYTIEKSNRDSIFDINSHYNGFYSWENGNNAVLQNTGNLDYYLIKNEMGRIVGYSIISPKNSQILQIESLTNDLIGVIQSLSIKYKEIKINNVLQHRVDYIASLQSLGLDNYINQFEMFMEL